MAKLTRIEEVKKILGKATFSCESKGDYSICQPNIDNEDMIVEQICQLFSQPLDDKELEKAIYQVLIDNTSKRRERYGDIEVTHIDTNIGDSIQPISALLQPKIEEAKREERERIIRIVLKVAKDREENFGSQRGWVADIEQALKGGE